jgi:membrane protein
MAWRVPGSFTSGLGWRELVSRTIKETNDDDGLGLAAQLAYYFFLALFPALLFLLGLASFFHFANLGDVLAGSVGRVAAPELVEVLRQQLEQISNSKSGGILSIGFLGALWSSSAALVSIVSALNRAYDIEESRPWWKVRLVAMGLTIGLAVFILSAVTLVLAGPTLAEMVGAWAGLGPAFVWTWKIVQWPLVFVLIAVALAVVYYFAPDADQEWTWVSPGAVLATTLWLVASLIFRFYVVNFGSYQQTYGALGGVIVLMLWLYLTGLAILVGAEMNAEAEHASPWGKDAGEKTPGARKKLGSLAAQDYYNTPPAANAPRAPIASPAPRVVPAAAREPSPVIESALAFLLHLVWPRLRRHS